MEDTILLLSMPLHGVDGQLIYELAIPKGTQVMVGSWICNIDKSLWGEDAEEWKPERWLSPLPQSLIDARIPGVYSHL